MAAPGVAQEALLAVVKNTPLASAPPERLVRIAAWASDHAAASARLELYPRGLHAKRALQLCSGAVSAKELKVEELNTLVCARYPESEPLPTRPALDALVKHELGLRWFEDRQAYARDYAPGETRNHTQHSTSHRSASTGRLRSSSLVTAPIQTPEQQVASDFERDLQIALERFSFKVLRVGASKAEALARAIRARFNVQEVSLDELLLKHARAFAAEHEFALELVYTADRAGKDSDRWNDLVSVMREAATRTQIELLAKRGMLLLTRPGLLARYGLNDLVVNLRDAVATTDGLGILFIVPSEAANPALVIDGRPYSMELEALPAHRLEVPPAWIRQHTPAILAA